MQHCPGVTRSPGWSAGTCPASPTSRTWSSARCRPMPVRVRPHPGPSPAAVRVHASSIPSLQAALRPSGPAGCSVTHPRWTSRGHPSLWRTPWSRGPARWPVLSQRHQPSLAIQHHPVATCPHGMSRGHFWLSDVPWSSSWNVLWSPIPMRWMSAGHPPPRDVCRHTAVWDV